MCVLEECGPEGPSGYGFALGRSENRKPGPFRFDCLIDRKHRNCRKTC
jgi:hypothetical protein